MSVGYAAIISIAFDQDTFGEFFVVYGLCAFIYQSLGYICAIALGQYSVLGAILLTPCIILFQCVLNRDLSKFMYQLSHLVPIKQADNHLILLLFGHKKCPDTHISSIIYRFNLVDDDYDSATHLLIFQSFLYLILCYLSLKLYVNWHSIQIQIKRFRQN